jgi:hypothetical protein
LKKKVYQKVSEEMHSIKMVKMETRWKLVVLTKSKGPQGYEYRLLCNFKSSYSDFSGSATPEWFLPLMCPKGFLLHKQSCVMLVLMF